MSEMQITSIKQTALLATFLITVLTFLSSQYTKDLAYTTRSEKLLYIGIFSRANDTNRRSLLRNLYSQFPPQLKLTLEFVVSNSREIQQESLKYRDLRVLDIPEGGNEGKTFTYFSTLDSTTHQFYMKADDDTFLHLPHVVRVFSKLPTKGTYWGRPRKSRFYYPFYHFGAAYAVSSDIISVIKRSRFAASNTVGSEDLVFGSWLQHENCIFNFEKTENAGNVNRFVNLTRYPGIIYIHDLKNENDLVRVASTILSETGEFEEKTQTALEPEGPFSLLKVNTTHCLSTKYYYKFTHERCNTENTHHQFNISETIISVARATCLEFREFKNRSRIGLAKCTGSQDQKWKIRNGLVRRSKQILVVGNAGWERDDTGLVLGGQRELRQRITVAGIS